ncbi:beta-ketoacyl-ACP synthase III [Pediococcus argentinicus]|uniref:Beta-ketoacyl-[acyl-carrier-protein] synthase III n=1 Tax=Pediococcus argentinicus TaxID=480391 RepID=A0A0R2NN41_9LACO|nr:beta-ketoacyl-ACP synthase III [Pediococcus argentinicus]KRO25808.1 3-oxoacyl-(acyl carrier protein) synthase iii [Pediococcus argentinicus]NKZ21975.1 ketoacyl-ACP synthase III [Pediococcus argentinicus]GEP19144.1 3-oxoacyl-[acyl-carrier-protein] synthase 3 protein 1 [Pediococcus argentinicus]
MSVKISATAHYVPERIVTNDDLARVMDTNDEWIQKHTGIKTRHFAMDDENTSDLATKVGEELLQKSGLSAEQIDLIIVSTITPDSLTPATANLVQRKLNAKNAFSFDISSACAGFVFGLSTAEKFMRSGRYQHAIVISAETNSKMMDFQDRTSAVFFGDGAGGVILSNSDQANDDFYVDEKINTAANGTEYIHSGRINPIKEIKSTNFPSLDAFYQDGRKVFEFATGIVPEQMKTILEKNHLTETIDYVIPHQANLRIIEQLSQKLDLPMEKFVVNVVDYGNTSSAGLAMALDQLQQKHPEPKTVLLTGFGAGLDFGSIIIKL